MCESIGHQPFRGHCPAPLNSYHNLLKQGTGTADHLTLLWLLFFRRFWAFWAHCSCPNALVTSSSTAPAQPHAIGVTMYPALFFNIGKSHQIFMASEEEAGNIWCRRRVRKKRLRTSCSMLMFYVLNIHNGYVYNFLTKHGNTATADMLSDLPLFPTNGWRWWRAWRVSKKRERHWWRQDLQIENETVFQVFLRQICFPCIIRNLEVLKNCWFVCHSKMSGF